MCLQILGIETYDYNNTIPYTYLYYAFNQIISLAKPDFALDLNFIAACQFTDSFSRPIINKPSIENKDNY